MSAGKGDSPRPFSVSQDEYDIRWKIAFGKKKEKKQNIRKLQEIQRLWEKGKCTKLKKGKKH